MTSGIDELEALLGALHLSFLTSSSATSSPETLRQSIAAFRAALRPQGIVVASPSLTVAHMQKPDDGNHHDFVNAGGPSSATSTTCGDDDRIDMLAKHMDFVHAELRQGTDHIRELIQSVQELKIEVRDLRSAMVAPKSLASTEDHPSPSPQIINAVENCAALASVYQAQVEPAPSPYAAGGSRSILSMPICPQPIPEVTTSSSIPSLIISARSFIPPEPPSLCVAPQLISGETPMTSAYNPRAIEVTELPTLPHLRSEPPSPVPCPVAIPTPARTLNTARTDPPYCPRPPSSVPVPVNTSEAIPLAPESLKPVLFDIKPKDYSPQTVPHLTGKKRTTRKTRATNDGGNPKAEDPKGSEDSVIAEPCPKSSVIATAVRYSASGIPGELKFKPDDKITILDHATTPVGWMYGETVETRRGIFPAHYVQEVPPLGVKEKLNDDHFSDNPEIIRSCPKSPAIVTAVQYFRTGKGNELSLSRGDRIQVLDSPDTPDGWMYGEVVETRRGIFPARFVTLE